MKIENIVKTILAVSMGISGLILIGYYTSWLVALGVFLMVWSNNLGNV